jgi:hypothetical protein
MRFHDISEYLIEAAAKRSMPDRRQR